MSFESSPREPEDDDVDEIVATCLESDPVLLESAVERACSSHPELAYEIRTRIEALRTVGLVRPTGLRGDERFPERLGEFSLVERLGGGGMGVVFRARQESLGREVALKLIRPEHLYFPRARERFLREIEAAARLQHRGIVPIYSVGESEGLPHFAMELVPGCTLGDALRRLAGRAPESSSGRDLERAIRAALPAWVDASAQTRWPGFDGSYVACVVELVIQVADALQHAHQRGVLHRDVKPSNIAVTLDGHARLFDFGLAALSEQPSALTASHAEIGSLLYMSPEHLRRSGGAVDRRSDLYSLGVTLYELLTLQVPYYDPDAVKTRALILEGRPDAIRARNRAVPADLETVCFKAMERDPSRRYADAAAFAADLRNVLERRPITARPPSGALRVRRWMQRHPTTSVAAALGLLIVVGGPLALYAQQRVHASELQRALDQTTAAKREADRQRGIAADEARDARTTAEFLSGVFVAIDPLQARKPDLKARDLLDSGAKRLQHDLLDQPRVRADLLTQIAFSYMSLGDFREPLPLLQQALEIRRASFGEESLEVADSLRALSKFERSVDPPRSVEHARQALELRRKFAPQVDLDLVEFVSVHAQALEAASDSDGAIAGFEEALALEKGLPGTEEQHVVMLANLASAQGNARRYELAAKNAAEAAAIARETLGEDWPGIGSCLNTRMVCLTGLGRTAEARQVCDELIEFTRRVEGEDGLAYATFVLNRAGLCMAEGDLDAALADCETAERLLARLVPPGHDVAVSCQELLQRILTLRTEWSRARTVGEALVERLLELEGPAAPRTMYARQLVADALEGLDDRAGAVEALAPSSELASEDKDAQRWIDLAHATRARLLATLGRFDEAAGELGAVASNGVDATKTPVAAVVAFAGALIERNGARPQEARAKLEPLAGLDVGPAPVQWLPSCARAELAGLIAGEDAARARDLATRAAAELRRRLGPEHPSTRAAVALEASLRKDGD